VLTVFPGEGQQGAWQKPAVAAISAITRASPNRKAGACRPSPVRDGLGQPVEGGHVGGGLGAGGLSVTQTLAGMFASKAQGVPVLIVHAALDGEVAGVADDQLSPEGAVLLVYCLRRLDL
jgi:hypothetical protein